MSLFGYLFPTTCQDFEVKTGNMAKGKVFEWNKGASATQVESIHTWAHTCSGTLWGLWKIINNSWVQDLMHCQHLAMRQKEIKISSQLLSSPVRHRENVPSSYQEQGPSEGCDKFGLKDEKMGNPSLYSSKIYESGFIWCGKKGKRKKKPALLISQMHWAVTLSSHVLHGKENHVGGKLRLSPIAVVTNDHSDLMRWFNTAQSLALLEGRSDMTLTQLQSQCQQSRFLLQVPGSILASFSNFQRHPDFSRL